MLKSSDSLILYLARKSITQFKELFPTEEPFIKIICLRDKRLCDEYRSGKRSWRKIEIINKDGTDVHDIVEQPMIDLQTVTTERKIYHRGEANVTQQVNKKKGKYTSAINEITGKKERVSKELTYTTRSTTKEILLEDLNVMVQSEIHTADLDSRYDFIQVGSKQSYDVDTIDSRFTTNGLIIPHTSTLNEMIESISLILPRVEADAKDTELLITKMKELKRVVNSHQKRIDELTPSSNVKSGIFKTDLSVEEMASKFISLQEKLNVVKTSIAKYTVREELGWDDLVKQKGFVLSLVDLIEYWYKEADVYEEDEYDSDD